MKILSFKSGHDGSVAGVDAAKGELLFSYESEKDSFPRYTSVTPDTFIDSGLWFRDLPDVLALSGWSTAGAQHVTTSGAGYFGIGDGSQNVGKRTFFGKVVDYFSSTHERAHIWGAYAMSPFKQGEPCYVLVWEGVLGDFYEIDAHLNLHHLGRVMEAPGQRYSFLYALADPKFPDTARRMRREDPGRLMAACAFGENGTTNPNEQSLIDYLLSPEPTAELLCKDKLTGSPFYNIGVDDPRLCNVAVKLSDAIFDRFHAAAEQKLTKGYPLIITGGCGLNCDWNTKWMRSGLFSDVFVPPCTSDSGCAIGTAVDAMRHYTGQAKLTWSVYAGQSFCDDRIDHEGLTMSEQNPRDVAQALMEGQIIGWARGNCEIGPRALGNRSILASPFSAEARVRLNRAKNRADISPVAPSCLEEDVGRHFDSTRPSPHMLYFQKVTDPALEAITHVDGSARVQTVARNQNPMFYDLLIEFRAISGSGVLCNTSLNFRGAGFINKTSDLCHYARSAGLDGFVAGNSFYRFV
ncbi:carbamoyltransferase C-terminal domain-containing protein [Ruegeria sp. HKCCD8929]|uniref:carbamoyltransferase C-terminal domain-containing protein n=1 Tax=Ruegeria sp. HKCCD8929 TaxID=2683006 RepID=UPI001489591A|nr:carbamoyltransferase C-terminal domain-containing protein [Ruegeria sp. HKCCD8929]